MKEKIAMIYYENQYGENRANLIDCVMTESDYPSWCNLKHKRKYIELAAKIVDLLESSCRIKETYLAKEIYKLSEDSELAWDINENENIRFYGAGINHLMLAEHERDDFRWIAFSIINAYYNKNK